MLRTLVLSVAVLLLVAACGGAAPVETGPPPGADSTAPVLTISQSEITLAHECTPTQTVHITGSTNIVQLVEPCHVVTATGSTNQVVIQATDTLVIGGHNQHVTVQKVTSGVIRMSGSENELVCGSRTLVQDTGSGNTQTGCSQ